MKQLALWAKANEMPLFGLLITIAVLMTWTSESWAYDEYAAGCDDCHGGFRSSPYTSLSDGSNWGNDLHDVHRHTMLGGDCDACHAGGFSPVSLDVSDGGSGLSAISCVGCHGREEDMGNDSESAGRGAGLRQHHTNAGEADCVGCHTDAVPANYTPVGEDVLPDYYANPGTTHPAMPLDSCNASGTENFAGTAIGLDNDGDGNYDSADSDCSVTFSVGGNVSGLAGSGLLLQNNGGNDLAISTNGSFTFTSELTDGSGYAVTVKTQPSTPAQFCIVTNGTGAVPGADVIDVQVTCTLATSCNQNIISGVTEFFDATHEACEILILGPGFIAADGSNVSANSGLNVEFLPGFIVEQGATLNANVCGQSLCMTSSDPMPYGCHSCVDQICDIDPSCCTLEFDQACLDRVSTTCGLVCE